MYDVIPENDITAENSALVPIGINAPLIVNDNLDTVNDSQNDVPDQPAPLHLSQHLHRHHNWTAQTMT